MALWQGHIPVHCGLSVCFGVPALKMAKRGNIIQIAGRIDDLALKGTIILFTVISRVVHNSRLSITALIFVYQNRTSLYSANIDLL